MSSPERHIEICIQLNQTYKKKNADYGDSFNKGINEYGYTYALCKLHDKYMRITTLLGKDSRQVKSESVADTLLDMANYCIMLAMRCEDDKGDQ
jgi:hypothetical protein